jgi:hypothetical protein
MSYILRIDRVKITFAKTQIMDGIKEVGLAYPIVTDKAIYAGGK